MAETFASSRLLVAARPAKVTEKSQTMAERTEAHGRLDKIRGRTRVNIGSAFHRWSKLRESKGFKSDAIVALFLLDCYEKNPGLSTLMPWSHESLGPPPPAGSAVTLESFSERDVDLSVSADEMFELFERRIEEYEEQIHHLKEENEQKQKLLDTVFNPEVQLHQTDVHQMMVKDVPLEQTKRSSSLNQKNPAEPAHIKEEQEEEWSCQEPQEADIIKFTYFPFLIKSEEEDEEETRPHTGADGEDCGGSEPDRDFNPHSYLQPLSPDKSPHCSGSDTDDSADWEEVDEPEEGLNPQQSKDGAVSDLKCTTGDTPVSSSDCAPGFGQRKQWQRHNGILTREKLLSCSVCGNMYPGKRNLQIHMQRHAEEKPFNCSVCQKGFHWRAEMEKHMRFHSGEKPYSCSVCGKRFTQSGSLKRHFTVHTGEKPFVCMVCGKRFARSEHLKGHAVVHTGEKPFGCSLCEKSFTQKGDLKRHSLVHTRDGSSQFSHTPSTQITL